MIWPISNYYVEARWGILNFFRLLFERFEARTNFFWDYNWPDNFKYASKGRNMITPKKWFMTRHCSCRLLVPGNTQKILTEIWHHFWLKMMVKWFRKKYFEIPQWPSEIPPNLPCQFSLSGQIFLHWAAATLKAIVEFQNDFF